MRLKFCSDHKDCGWPGRRGEERSQSTTLFIAIQTWLHQPALYLMQLLEMSWQPAKPGVNQRCQSATTASQRVGGGGGQGEHICKDGSWVGVVEKFFL